MREIKFRVWDGVKFEDHFCLGRLNVLQLSSCLPPGYLLQQYSGLKDKNGKEIYEGDIIKGYNYKGEDIIYEAVSLFYFHHWQETQDLIDDENDKSVEVIGNIYQNADLLTG